MATVHRFWDQKIIGECNGQLIKLAKGTGAIHWHQHDDQDELFLLYKGQLTIQLKGRNVDLLPGDLFVVPK
ncbi:MAG: cupin domain-containing protein, partial [Sphingobacteriales bacterium]